MSRSNSILSLYAAEKLLVANRGEIAVRILKTAKKLGFRTVAIYTPLDATSPHVSLADESVCLTQPRAEIKSSDSTSSWERDAYTSIPSILSICIQHDVTLVHPGYGFLAENASFAQAVRDAGITFLGPSTDTIRTMGLKDKAKDVARRAGIPVVPGSEGGVVDEEECVDVAKRVGFPVMLKATAGGGGLGMVICRTEVEVRTSFRSVRERAANLFGVEEVIVEKYLESARHIEVQVFGTDKAVIHMGERECSVQRRQQKIIEESPSPFLTDKPALRDEICNAAVRLCQEIGYTSAGTVEFIVDDQNGAFYFLEMNTRIQVEHPVTEQRYPGLDIVELMILNGVLERHSGDAIDLADMEQRLHRWLDLSVYAVSPTTPSLHSIEARIYAENPFEQFRPSPGVLQYVDLLEGEEWDWLRVDTWVSTGTSISPIFDPLLAKVVVTGRTREEALKRLLEALHPERGVKLYGPPNNVEYIRHILQTPVFVEGRATTAWLESGEFLFTPNALTITSIPLLGECTIQQYPGRTVGLGIPRSGPMDPIALRAANILVDNAESTEGLELVIVPGPQSRFECTFHTTAVIAITGKDVLVRVDGKEVEMWARVVVRAGESLTVGERERGLGGEVSGFRVYVAVGGGFSEVPEYLGSKSCSMGLGGYQGRSLLPGDQIALGIFAPGRDTDTGVHAIPLECRPPYPEDNHWDIAVLSGPQDDGEYLTPGGIQRFYETRWRVTPSSNRMGIRLEPAGAYDREELSQGFQFDWARQSGGEGGSHPSNILDNGYAFGSVNVNGDTPVILGSEGPDMGGVGHLRLTHTRSTTLTLPLPHSA